MAVDQIAAALLTEAEEGWRITAIMHVRRAGASSSFVTISGSAVGIGIERQLHMHMHCPCVRRTVLAGPSYILLGRYRVHIRAEFHELHKHSQQ